MIETVKSESVDFGSLKWVSCYSCNSDAYTPYATECGYSLVKCSGCGLLYINPRLPEEQISAAHRVGVHRGEFVMNHTGRFAKFKVGDFAAKVRDFYGRGLSGGVWLDIGSGHGEFLLAVKEVSGGKVRLKGVEPNDNKRKNASAHGLDTAWFDLAAHHEKYDYISLLNVFSHLPNPPEVIQSVAGKLNPGGEFLLQTGDTSNLSADEHPRPFALPDHMSFASESIVTGIMERAGFKVLEVRKYPSFAYCFAPSILTREIVKLFVPGKRSNVPNLYKLYKFDRRHKTDMWIRAKVV